ncbi:MAG TPA: dihydrofolate reductase [Tepidisphaeraceae bacterium]|nr:dihydrofolate reductase [Tepidisphaeraceae bacterium]
MSEFRLELVAAIAKNGVIGRKGQLAWHLPDDLKHFKSLTLGHPILMGRKTYESISRPLPGRRNIVVSSSMKTAPAGIDLASSLDQAIRLASQASERAFIIGGAVLYAAALPHVQRLHLTELDDAVEGDAIFPPFDKSQWKLTSETPHPKDDRHAIAFRLCTYERA